MKVVEEFTVDKTPVEVFNYVAVNYFDNHAKFDPEIRGMIWRTEPPVTKGTKGAEKRSFAGLPVRLNFEITSFDKPKYFAFKNTSGPFWLDRSYRLEPMNKGTKVIFVFDIRPKILFKPIFPLLKSKFKKSVQQNIKSLSEQLGEL